MSEHVVSSVDELADGDRLVVQLEGREIAVFNIDGEYFAYTNWCAHQGGPACEGKITGTTDATFDKETLETDFSWTREGEVLTCPWHAWEFDVTTGDCLSREGIKLIEHAVEVEGDNLVVSL
jgi:nitrite reductase/ring-hydroxylating ferredoxin subunit